MKKKILLTLSLISFSIFCFGQDNYKVLFTNGHVFINKSKVKKGDIIENVLIEKIDFNNKKGILKICYKNCSKIKVITYDLLHKTTSKKISELITYFEPLAGRGDVNYDFIDIKKLKSIEKIGAIDTLKVSIKDTKLSVDKDNLFYMRYKYLGDVVNKILKTKGETLYITQDIFKTKSHGTIESEKLSLNLYHYNKKLKKSSLIVPDFQILFLNKELLKDDISYLLKKENSGLSNNDKIIFLNDYVKLKYPNIYINKLELFKLLK